MRILMVAFYSHPCALVGAQRVTKFIKFLSNDSQKTIDVITVKEKYYNVTHSTDSGWNAENVNVYRTNIARRILPIRDEGLVWLVPLMLKMISLGVKNRYDVVYITGNPFLNFVLLPFFKLFFKTPYVLDFRDPWSLSPYRSSKSKLYGMFINKLENFAVKHASAVINVTTEAKALFIKHYSKIPSENFVVVENGFDDTDFLNLANIDLQIKYGVGMYICYAGKFSNFRNPEQFVKAISLYNATKKQNKKIRLIHVGEEEAPLKKLFNYYEIEEFYICTGFMPYRSCLEYINSSDLALLISGGDPYEPTTKIFDYIALDKKVLGIIPGKNKGFLSQVFSEYSKAILVDDDSVLIQYNLDRLYNLSDASHNNLRSRFSREEQALKLNGILTKASQDLR